ncbi:hypothetical protein [Neptunicella sp.]|uniref:hypothetical protein n=1 Tax=Neptunicella sp. TaxID=2125986 RepID=UPI003F68F21F
MSSFLVKQMVSEEKKHLGADDLYLNPNVTDISTMDFERLEDADNAGNEEASRHVEQLQRFSVSPDVYAAWMKRQRSKLVPELNIDSLALENMSSLDDEVLLQRLGFNNHSQYDTSQLKEGIRQVYGLDIFERVSSHLYQKADGGTELKVTAEEKSWGPGYLNFRLMLEDDFHSNRNMQFAASYTRTGLSSLGAEWQTEIALGTDKVFSTELYWPLVSPSTFVSGKINNHSESLVVEDPNGLSLGEFFKSETVINGSLGWNISDQGVLTTGWIDKNGSYRLPSILANSLGYSRLDYRRKGVEWRFVWDSLNNANFSTRGIRFKVQRQWLDDRFLEASSDSINSSYEFIAAKHWHNHVFKTRWSMNKYQSQEGDIGLEQYALGGLLNLSGYPRNYLYGPDARFGSFIYMYQMNENRFSFFDSLFYLGGSIERGRVKESWLQPEGNDIAEWIWAGSIFAGWDSPLGAIYLGYGQAEDTYRQKAYRVYLSLGQSY